MNDAHGRALQFLFGRLNYERTPPRQGTEAFRLGRMRELLDRLGRPDEGLPIVHVAGTKGKGSTAAMIACCLTAAGYRAGLYTSPHLQCLEERFAVDGLACAPQDLAEMVESLRPAVAAMDAAGDGDGPTFFELTTALAWLDFARRGAEIAVLEVGLGGRLDSTNVCRPEVTLITNISFDHTRQLGNTLASIAGEKAGIVKPGVPLVSGVEGEESLAVIQRVCRERNAPWLQLGRDFGYEHTPAHHLERDAAADSMRYWGAGELGPPMEQLELGLLGRHQATNAASAIACLALLRGRGWRIEESAIRSGLASVRCPGRVEVLCRRPTVVLDTAHNLASIEATLTTLRESFEPRRRTLVFGASGEKDLRGMLRQLTGEFDRIILTRFVENPRAADPRALAALAAEFGAASEVADSPEEAWRMACEEMAEEDLICVTGSFFLAAEMRVQIDARRPCCVASTL